MSSEVDADGRKFRRTSPGDLKTSASPQPRFLLGRCPTKGDTRHPIFEVQPLKNKSKKRVEAGGIENPDSGEPGKKR
jgi:hypothetical protein